MPDSNSSDPMLMPGPQFSEDEQNNGWFRRNSQKIIITLIVALLGLSGFYLYKNYQQRQDLLRPTIENLSESPALNVVEEPSLTAAPAANDAAEIGGAPTIAAQSQQKISSAPTATAGRAAAPAPKKAAPAAPEITVKGSQFAAKAQKGNGATHLARQVLKEYLKDKKDLNGSLKPEQKIYIEDYLRKHVSSPRVLKIGDTLSFDENQIKDAISLAQKLTDAQMKNLHKYVLLVPSLQ